MNPLGPGATQSPLRDILRSSSIGGDTGRVSFSTPTFPNHPGKHDGTPLISPENFLAELMADPNVVIPQSVIIGYSRRLPELLAQRDFHNTAGSSAPWNSMWLRRDEHEEIVGVVEGFGYGPSCVAVVLEELATLGVKRFINVGTAGALPTEVGFGDAVLCTGAIRDEGVSHHYLAPARLAYPSSGLTDELRSALIRSKNRFHEGTTWTIDAFFRETVEEATAYRDEGVVTVEMEAATLFTVAQLRGVEAASIFCVGDHLLAKPQWERAPQLDERNAALARILDVSLEVLEAHR